MKRQGVVRRLPATALARWLCDHWLSVDAEHVSKRKRWCRAFTLIIVGAENDEAL